MAPVSHAERTGTTGTVRSARFPPIVAMARALGAITGSLLRCVTIFFDQSLERSTLGFRRLDVRRARARGHEQGAEEKHTFVEHGASSGLSNVRVAVENVLGGGADVQSPPPETIHTSCGIIVQLSTIVCHIFACK